MDAKVTNNETRFRTDMFDAFNNFKSSSELQQAKRMRHFSDMLNLQKHLLGQNIANEKNFLVFQKTSTLLCE